MAKLGTGAVVGFALSGFTGEILAIAWTDIAREAHAVDLMDAENWKEFVPDDLTDAGELQLEIAFDPDQQPPVVDDTETISVRIPASGGFKELSAEGFVQSWRWLASLEDKMRAEVVCKMTGAINTTATLTLMKNDDGDQAYNDDGDLAYVA